MAWQQIRTGWEEFKLLDERGYHEEDPFFGNFLSNAYSSASSKCKESVQIHNSIIKLR